MECEGVSVLIGVRGAIPKLAVLQYWLLYWPWLVTEAGVRTALILVLGAYTFEQATGAVVTKSEWIDSMNGIALLMLVSYVHSANRLRLRDMEKKMDEIQQMIKPD